MVETDSGVRVRNILAEGGKLTNHASQEVTMDVALWLNAAGLTVGFVGALVIGFFPPKVQEYNSDGSPKYRLVLESQPTAWGRFRVKLDPWLSGTGPFLLALAFVLQILALLLPWLCQRCA